jgi:hypothetical protein
MIHDGLAENGHYYSYVYDRVVRAWWKLDDHRVSRVDEATVMAEAYGGEGYKSACNLFYISAHVSEMIESRQQPLFGGVRASELPISKAVIAEVRQTNHKYEEELLRYTSQKKVEGIRAEFEERQRKLAGAME